jgi:hypothetical protein
MLSCARTIMPQRDKGQERPPRTSLNVFSKPTGLLVKILQSICEKALLSVRLPRTQEFRLTLPQPGP